MTLPCPKKTFSQEKKAKYMLSIKRFSNQIEIGIVDSITSMSILTRQHFGVTKTSDDNLRAQ